MRRLSTSTSSPSLPPSPFSTNAVSPSVQKLGKRPIFSTRQHYGKQLGEDDDTISTSTQAGRHRRRHRSSRRVRPGLVRGSAVVLVVILWVCALLRQSPLPAPIKPLRDQPSYDAVLAKRQCTATLCNSLGRCATWLPHRQEQQHHSSNSQGQKSDPELRNTVYRDVATIDVDLGCELMIKLANETWMTVAHTGTVTDCRVMGCTDVVEMDLKDDLYILASQLKQLAVDPTTTGQEIVALYPGDGDDHPSSTTAVGEEKDVTLVSQFSVNRLGVFTQVMDAWDGPISIAIYLTDPNDISQLKSFFAIPANMVIYSRATIVFVKPDYTSADRLKYPINHLRNLALHAATTSHVFVMDADFLPSSNLYTHARDALLLDASSFGPRHRQTAIVIPCYAIREEYKDDPLPKTTAELKALVDKDIAYITDPGSGHGPTLAVPMMTTSTSTDSSSSNGLWYEVCYESQWEPYYIVPKDPDSMILYDVRFRNQGGDKQSHALQLNAAGFQFLVSTQTFILHRDHSKMVWPGGGFAQSQKAYTQWNYFAEFMREMEDLYGTNVRWPKSCSATAIGWQVQQRSPIGILMG